MTREQKIKAIEQVCDTVKQLGPLIIRAFTPPTDEQLMQYLATLSNIEVEGIYHYGSKQGRRLAKIECMNRGIIKESFFKRLFSKLKK
jgi:hypothetical protein